VAAECLKSKGDLSAINGDFRQAKEYYLEGKALAWNANDQLLCIRICSNLGIAYKNLGKMDSAISILNGVSVDFAKALRTHEDSIVLALHYIQLFDVYKAEGFLEDAIYYGEEGYRLSAILNYQRGIGYGLYIQGIKRCKEDPAGAMKYCDSALAIAKAGKISELEVFIRSLKADIYIFGGQYKQAERELLPDLHMDAGSIRLVTWSKLSRVYYLMGEYSLSLQCFQQALELANVLGYNSELVATLENGIAVYEKTGNYQVAFHLLRRLDEVKAAMASEKLKLDYDRAALRFRADQKDKELAKAQLILEQKESRLNRQSWVIVTTTLVWVVVIVVAWLIYWQQKRLQAQRIRNLEAEKENQMLGAAMNAEERERSRIAKDLHDGIGGILSATKMRFSIFRNEYPELRNSEEYNRILSMLDEASSEVRKTAHNLMPDTLNRCGLDEALQLFCEKMSTGSRLRIDYQSVGEIGRFNAFFELTVYRMVQELVNNIIRHSHARNACVQLSRQQYLMMISVEDDGKGFDRQKLEDSGGIGIRSIKERVRTLGGTVEIDSSEGDGSSVYVELDISNFADN
jgi:signal transduction histidine kinase